MIDDLKNNLKMARGFLKDGVWDANLQSLPVSLAILVRILRVFILMVRGIKDDELLIRASALTYLTLVSIVPMLSIALSVSKGLGYGDDIFERIYEFSQGQPENVQDMIAQIMHLVENTNFQGLGWIGVAFLVFTATMVLNGLEKSINSIWGINRHRNMVRRISNYISLLFVVPIFIGVAGTIQGMGFSESSVAASTINNLFIAYTPYISTFIGLALLYLMLPNTKVSWLPAIISALLAAGVWLLWQRAFISLQLSVVKYNAIYGTFASIPIFLVWLHTSWVIVLLGAETSFAVQYHNTLHLERGALGASPKMRQLLALSVMLDNAKLFLSGEGCFDRSRYSEIHKVPIRLVNEVVRLLVKSGLLVEISDSEHCYVLAKAPDTIKVKDIIELVVTSGKGADDFQIEDIGEGVKEILDSADAGIGTALENKTLAALASS